MVRLHRLQFLSNGTHKNPFSPVFKLPRIHLGLNLAQFLIYSFYIHHSKQILTKNKFLRALLGLSLILFQIVKRNAGTRKLEKYYHLVGWGVPCVGTVFPDRIWARHSRCLAVLFVAGFREYGLTSVVNGSCYIRSSILIFTTFFLPGFVLVCINSVRLAVQILLIF